MKQIIFLSFIMIFCFDLQIDAMFQSDKIKQKDKSFNANVALKFMDSYVKFCNSRQTNEENWVEDNKLLTDRFKSTYKKIMDDANKADPEFGLDFDPIFDAQDYPDKGFKIIKYDSASGFVILCGKDWKEYTVTVKVVFQNNKWLVDGVGIINIPKDKQRIR